MTNKKLWPAALVGLGFAIGGFFPGYYYYAAKMNNRAVVVKGLAEVEVKADLAIWDIKFLNTGNDLNTLQTKMQRDLKNIMDFLSKSGFSSDEIIVGRINTNDLMANPYRSENNGPRYILNQTVTVRSVNVDTVETTLRAIGGLVSDGVIFDSQEYSSPVSYLFTGLNDIKPQMLEQATKNARKAADEFAKSSRTSVGGIKHANQGVFSILPREETPGTSETSQINKKIRVVSTVEYYLK